MKLIWDGGHFGDRLHFGVIDAFFMLFRCRFDGLTDKAPPDFETGLCRLSFAMKERIAEQDGIECPQDLAAVGFGPSDRVRVIECAIFGVGAIDDDPSLQAARSEIAARSYVIAGKEMDGGGAGGDGLADTEATIGIPCGGAGPFDVRAGDFLAIGDVVPDESGHLRPAGPYGAPLHWATTPQRLVECR